MRIATGQLGTLSAAPALGCGQAAMRRPLPSRLPMRCQAEQHNAMSDTATISRAAADDLERSSREVQQEGRLHPRTSDSHEAPRE